MKYKLIATYAKILFVVEDFLAKIETAVNSHRARVEEKWWEHISDL